MGYDPQTSQFLLFGGLAGTKEGADFNDTWTWNGTSWTQVDDSTLPGCGDPATPCPGSPPLRAVATMAYDATTHQFVLFGGQGAGTLANVLNDTWVWNGTSWAQVDDATAAGCGSYLDVCPTSPPGRSGAAMAYDGATGQLLLFGGLTTGFKGVNDTWAWNGTTWSQIDDATDPGCTTSCATSPPWSVTSTMAYDQASDQLVLFGAGNYEGNATWIWNGTTWSQVDDAGDAGCTRACTTSPPTRYSAEMDYDPALGQLVLFGGALNDTWAWDGSSWAQIADGTSPGCGASGNLCPDSPPLRSAFPMANDAATGQLVVFGGQGGSLLDDTWYLPSAAASTVTTVTVAPNSVTVGHSVTYSATVTSASGTPTGTVTFSVGATQLCMATLSSGSATCSATNAPLGSDTVTGTYGGDPTHADSSGTTTLTVTSGATGYDLVGTDGGVFVFDAPGQTGGFYGSLPGLQITPTEPIVGIVPTVTDTGYVLVGADGGVFAFGNAPFLGSLPGIHVTPNQPIVGIAAANTDRGYFLVGADGGVYAFGTVPYLGSLPGNGRSVSNVIGISAEPSGQGYWVVQSTGTVTAFGTAASFTTPTTTSPVTAIAGTASGKGYWLVTEEGAVYPFGDAQKAGAGTLPAIHVTPNLPIIGIVPLNATTGYWLLGADGSIFAFNAPFYGSLPGLNPPVTVTDIVGAVPN